MWARFQYDRWSSEAAFNKENSKVEQDDKDIKDEENNEKETAHGKDINQEMHEEVKDVKNSENSKSAEIRSCL